MNRISNLVNKYGQLHRLGTDILKTHKKINGSVWEDMTHHEQEEKIHHFEVMAASVSKEWENERID